MQLNLIGFSENSTVYSKLNSLYKPVQNHKKIVKLILYIIYNDCDTKTKKNKLLVFKTS